jgi:hypothetical protein
MKIQHPFIVNLNYAFQTKDKLYMILDYINGGELFFHLKKEGRFAESRVKLYAAEIVCALAHLHSLGILYIRVYVVCFCIFYLVKVCERCSMERWFLNTRVAEGMRVRTATAVYLIKHDLPG